MKLFSILALTCSLNVAVAQSSRKTVAPDKSSRAAFSTTNKTLTPKSAMPAQRKPSAAPLANNNNSSKMSAELSRLERGDNLASSPGKTAAKVPPVKSPSSEHSPPINATYKKPSTSTAVKKPGW